MNETAIGNAQPARISRLEAGLASLILSIAVLTRWQGLDVYTGSYPKASAPSSCS